MKNLKQIKEIKNLLIDVKHLCLGMDDFNLTCKIDQAVIAFINEYDKQTKGMKGSEILDAIK